MTLDEMKLAVCEKLPELISVIKPDDSGCQFVPYAHWREHVNKDMPLVNWPTEGLQVCNEAEKLLCQENKTELYVITLIKMLRWSARKDSYLVLMHATYEQRLEALCHVWWPERFV